MRNFFSNALFGLGWPGPCHPDTIEHQNGQACANPQSYCTCNIFKGTFALTTNALTCNFYHVSSFTMSHLINLITLRHTVKVFFWDPPRKKKAKCVFPKKIPDSLSLSLSLDNSHISSPEGDFLKASILAEFLLPSNGETWNWELFGFTNFQFQLLRLDGEGKFLENNLPSWEV